MDHDRLFKTLLTTFFVEFLDLFAPELIPHIDLDSIEFLDKEIFTDIASGERHEVDLLVKVRFKGKETCFLVHVENQATAEEEIFAERMFRYFARLSEKYRLPVYPIVIFSYDKPRKLAPDRYEVNFPGLNVLAFRFHVIQLNRLNWRDYLSKPNPIAGALMTKMNFAPHDRPFVKLECLRMIVTLKLNPAKSTLIGTFMNNYLKLTTKENAVYNQAMKTIAPKEKEDVLVLTNEWIEQGIEQGMVEASRDIVMRLLSRRFDKIPSTMRRRIERLKKHDLTDLAGAILDITKLSDVEKWLNRRKR